MKVYVVMEPSYEWNELLGVFSTRRKARKYVNKLYLRDFPRAAKAPKGWNDYLGGRSVEVWEVDEEAI